MSIPPLHQQLMMEMGCGSPQIFGRFQAFVSVYLHGRADDKQGTEKGGGRLSKLINTLRKVIRVCVEGKK